MSTSRIIVALAIFVQAACAAPRSAVTPKSAPGACPVPKPGGTPQEKVFDQGKPPLPAGLSCLDWPMGDGLRQINSVFMDPKHPFVPGAHDGTDLNAAAGTSVLAPVAGTVEWLRGVAPCQDAAVAVRFADGWSYQVHHLSRVDVESGQKVVRGQRLGLSGGEVDAPGSGPWTTGPHLHFSLLHEGAFVDAAKYFCP